MRRAIAAWAVAATCVLCGAEREVRWNGRALKTEPARISARPVNRYWDGTQRPLTQTRMAEFVSLDVSGPGTLEVRGTEPLPPYTVFPLTKKGLVTRDGERLSVRIDKPGALVLDFGAAAEPLHIFANPPAEPPPQTGKMRTFGPGRHEAGVIVPESGETIYLAEGAVVSAAVFVDRAKDVRICGRGIFDFSAFERCDKRVSEVRQARGYPAEDTEFACGTFVICGSTNVTVEGVILRDAPFWTCIVRGESRNVTVDNVKVIGAWRYNADGIDVAGSENVTVRNCFVRSFDDCAVVLDGYLDGRAEDCRNVTFEDNVFWCDWGGCFKLWGGKFDSEISGVRFRRNVLANVQHGAFDIHCRLGCPRFDVRDVRVEDIEIDVTGRRLRPRVQKRDGEEFPDEWLDEMRLCLVETGWPQADTGNQGRRRMTEEEAAGTAREFDGIAFRRVTFPGETPKLWSQVKTDGPNQRIGTVTFEGMPKMELRKKFYNEETKK